MTYDSTTQAQPVMLDGEELKVGDEVIVARGPTNPANDSLWTSIMRNLVGCRGVFDSLSHTTDSDIRNFGEPVVCIDIDGAPWWFRLSELERVHTYHHATQPADTPTEFPNLVHTNETTGPGLLHPACRTSRTAPYNTAFLINERRLCPHDAFHGTLSLRPGYDAYLTQMEFEQAQNRRRERFAEWRDDRAYKRNQFLLRIRSKLTTHPFYNTKKGAINWNHLGLYDREHYTNIFKQQNRSGRAAAKILGRLVGHFHLTNPRPLPDDELFALLRSTLKHRMPFQARGTLEGRTDQAGAAYRAYIAAWRKIYNTGEWRRTPWADQDWFAQNSPNGDIPEESTTRKKIAPIWRVLRERD